MKLNQRQPAIVSHKTLQDDKQQIRMNFENECKLEIEKPAAEVWKFLWGGFGDVNKVLSNVKGCELSKAKEGGNEQGFDGIVARVLPMMDGSTLTETLVSC